jgi:hypothetical protein
MAEILRLWSRLPLAWTPEHAHHRRMTFYVLLGILLAIAGLAPRYGADSRIDGDHWFW